MAVLMMHTVAETRDLITAINGRVFDVNMGYMKIINSNGPDGKPLLLRDEGLQVDWPMWVLKWNSGSEAVSKTLDSISSNSLIPESVQVAEKQWQAILSLVNPQQPDGPYTDKDLPGLQIRISKLTSIPWQDRPQPKSFDLDFFAYQVADKQVQTVEEGGRAVRQGLAEVVRGAGEVVKTNPGTFLMIGGIVIGGLYLKKQIGL